MTPLRLSAFALPATLAAKADPALVADDERHFAAIAATLERTVADLAERLDTARRAPGRAGTAALERDQEIHRLSARLRTLRRFGLDLCLGRAVPDDGGEPVYVGRVGLTDGDGRRLLVDWRSPAAEPFFGATHARPMGLASRRRYRWANGRVRDYWDEVFSADHLADLAAHPALDDQSAFVASLAASRSDRMRDVLGTIQADQDAIIRESSRGTLVVDGGPGTGKTVVALHRTAYLLYADPRLGHRRGGVLVVGPHEPYLAYVADVLPSLGEEGVRTCTLRDLVPEGATAVPEPDPAVARLKGSLGMVEAIERAVAFYERPPAHPCTVETPWADVDLEPADWVEAFEAAEPGAPHNEARAHVWDALVEILLERLGGEEEVDAGILRRSLARDRDLAGAFNRAWPLLEATDLVGDLWTVPAYLRLCAPQLAPDDVARLQRDDPTAWTLADLPLLDAARARLGDTEAARRDRRRRAAAETERERRAGVAADLIAADDSELRLMSMLTGSDLQDALVDESAAPTGDPDALAGPFAHVVVDEAQELTDAEWAMVLRRCPSRSLTVVGDRAQARHGFADTWQERLERVGLTSVRASSLTINYRTPAEVMAEAELVIRAAVPDANVPVSVRSTGVPVHHGDVGERDELVATWLARHPEGVACVVGDPSFAERERVRSLSPELVKGLEFDLVVLVDPSSFGTDPDDVAGAVDRYVSMTRATSRLAVLRRPDARPRRPGSRPSRSDPTGWA